MSQSIDNIKNDHQKLYERALKDIPDFLRTASKASSAGTRINVEKLLRESENFEDYLDKLESLIEDIKSAAAQAESFDDYNWLMDAATQWQTVYSGTLNIPKSIQMPLPQKT